MAYKITCRDLTGENCGFTAKGETREETKNRFYKHGEKSPLQSGALQFRHRRKLMNSKSQRTS